MLQSVFFFAADFDYMNIFLRTHAHAFPAGKAFLHQSRISALRIYDIDPGRTDSPARAASPETIRTIPVYYRPGHDRHQGEHRAHRAEKPAEGSGLQYHTDDHQQQYDSAADRDRRKMPAVYERKSSPRTV